ncbi:hypothetical protein NCAS_0B03990 [Naumovozyma castellii]|uniref:Uncharacterized protein n=1 Tax=Naumovozyma castellii TaxID=27288 RepID=G0V9Z8_NAUCA|nr:hypothetical protein NCAS_0B03990 [Naumovozyma castellii CBS 4309]CCC68483.1 hypothetical protein NCAS_0B03990 [Naumovozyma castellii CBS 4309]
MSQLPPADATLQQKHSKRTPSLVSTAKWKISDYCNKSPVRNTATDKNATVAIADQAMKMNNVIQKSPKKESKDNSKKKATSQRVFVKYSFEKSNEEILPRKLATTAPEETKPTKRKFSKKGILKMFSSSRKDPINVPENENIHPNDATISKTAILNDTVSINQQNINLYLSRQKSSNDLESPYHNFIQAGTPMNQELLTDNQILFPSVSTAHEPNHQPILEIPISRRPTLGISEENDAAIAFNRIHSAEPFPIEERMDAIRAFSKITNKRSQSLSQVPTMKSNIQKNRNMSVTSVSSNMSNLSKYSPLGTVTPGRRRSSVQRHSFYRSSKEWLSLYNIHDHVETQQDETFLDTSLPRDTKICIRKKQPGSISELNKTSMVNITTAESPGYPLQTSFVRPSIDPNSVITPTRTEFSFNTNITLDGVENSGYDPILDLLSPTTNDSVTTEMIPSADFQNNENISQVDLGNFDLHLEMKKKRSEGLELMNTVPGNFGITDETFQNRYNSNGFVPDALNSTSNINSSSTTMTDANTIVPTTTASTSVEESTQFSTMADKNFLISNDLPGAYSEFDFDNPNSFFHEQCRLINDGSVLRNYSDTQFANELNYLNNGENFETNMENS